MMGAVLGLSCKPSSPQKKYTAEARDKFLEAGTYLGGMCCIVVQYLSVSMYVDGS